MLSKEEVKKIAHLARLQLTEKEVDKFSKQLSDILDYFETLKEVDTENVEPISQITGLTNVMYEDEVEAFDDPAALINRTPQKTQDNMIKVKSVFDD